MLLFTLLKIIMFECYIPHFYGIILLEINISSLEKLFKTKRII